MKIKALKAFTVYDSQTKDFLSIGHGQIAEVDSDLAAQLISAGLAEEVTEGSGGSEVVKDIVERTITNITADMLQGVTSIGTYAFAMFESLESIEIPGSVTSIGDASFINCSNLANVTIGDGITSIGNATFSGCSSLESVTVLATTPPTLVSEPFDSSIEAIYVPAGSVTAYQSAWQAYSSKIQAISE